MPGSDDVISALQTENQHLRQQLADLTRTRDHPESASSQNGAAPGSMPEQHRQQTLHQCLIDASLDGILVVGPDGKMELFNRRFVEMWGVPQEVVASRSDEAALGYVLGQLADAQQFIDKVQYLYDHPSERSRDDVLLKDGRIFERYSAPVEDGAGNHYGRVWFFRDITDRLQTEEALRRTVAQEQIIAAQQEILRELSTPLIPISERIVIMPLIGAIDSQRAQMVLERLLEGVTTHQPDLAILDITGLAVVDTQVAQALLQAARAVRLVGAEVMLTGIQPQIAQTLVQLGIDLNDIRTRSSLQDGVAYALRH